MDWSFARFWWDVLVGLSIAGNMLYTRMAMRSKANADAIERLAERINAIERDFGALSTTVSHLPTHRDIGALYEKVNEVARKVGELSSGMRAQAKTLGLIEDYLLNGGKGGKE